LLAFDISAIFGATTLKAKSADTRWGHIVELLALAESHTPAKFIDSLALNSLKDDASSSENDEENASAEELGKVGGEREVSGGVGAGAPLSLSDHANVKEKEKEMEKEKEKEKEDAGVTICTIHAAKGREWPVVFIVGVEDGILPHERSIQAHAAGSLIQLDEERRLLYGACFRSKRMWRWWSAIGIHECCWCQANTRVVRTAYTLRFPLSHIIFLLL
jgi:superfamily I DNA/RNA helicase